MLASLNHPDIAAPLRPRGRADGQPFLVMELVEGEDLSRAHRARGRCPLDEALGDRAQIAEALEAAHEKGIVHRDLKPANVKVGAGRRRSRCSTSASPRRGRGDAAGSPPEPRAARSRRPSPTAAPRRASSSAPRPTWRPSRRAGKPVDRRADVWAFGVVLFEMLTGRELFDGRDVSDIAAPRCCARDRLDARCRPATPPAMRRLLRRCLERDPKLRLRDIGEARIALGAPDETAAATAPPPAGLSRRAAAGLVAGAAGAAFALGFGLGRRSRAGGASAEGPATAPLTMTRITASGNVTGAAISPDGRLVAHVESEQGEQSLWLRQVATGQTLRLVPPRIVFYWGLAFTRDGNSIVYGLRSPEDIDGAFYSISTLGGTPRRLVSGIDGAPTFSPDGSRMAWVRARHPKPEQSALMVGKADGSEARVLAAIPLPEAVAPIFWTGPDWSPDGRRIACSVVRMRGGSDDAGGKVIAVSVDDGTVETLADPGWSWAAQVAWLPDSRGLLAVATGDVMDLPQVWLVPLPQGAPRRVTADLNDYRIVSLTADGRSLLTVAADVTASVWLISRDGEGPPAAADATRSSTASTAWPSRPTGGSSTRRETPGATVCGSRARTARNASPWTSAKASSGSRRSRAPGRSSTWPARARLPRSGAPPSTGERRGPWRAASSVAVSRSRRTSGPSSSPACTRATAASSGRPRPEGPRNASPTTRRSPRPSRPTERGSPSTTSTGRATASGSGSSPPGVGRSP